MPALPPAFEPKIAWLPAHAFLRAAIAYDRVSQPMLPTANMLAAPADQASITSASLGTERRIVSPLRTLVLNTLTAGEI